MTRLLESLSAGPSLSFTSSHDFPPVPERQTINWAFADPVRKHFFFFRNWKRFRSLQQLQGCKKCKLCTLSCQEQLVSMKQNTFFSIIKILSKTIHLAHHRIYQTLFYQIKLNEIVICLGESMFTKQQHFSGSEDCFCMVQLTSLHNNKNRLHCIIVKLLFARVYSSEAYRKIPYSVFSLISFFFLALSFM